VLCDPGWKRVYDKLLSSNMPNVQDSLNCWLPPDSGLREKIENISRKHPNGFGIYNGVKRRTEGTELMDTMEYRLRRVSGYDCLVTKPSIFTNLNLVLLATRL
jgi:hypothetical protein